ncbi:hypothetical protein ACWDTP_09580 [Mycobacterium sp. NPDC003449]
MLTDPCPALAEQSSFVGYLLGLSALGRMVSALAEPHPGGPRGEPADLVYLLLGVVRVGREIDRLGTTAAEPPPTSTAAEAPQTNTAAEPPQTSTPAEPRRTDTRWLR